MGKSREGFPKRGAEQVEKERAPQKRSKRKTLQGSNNFWGKEREYTLKGGGLNMVNEKENPSSGGKKGS